MASSQHTSTYLFSVNRAELWSCGASMRGAYVCSAQHTGDGSGSGRARPGFFDLTEQIWDMFLAAVAMFHTLQIPVVFSFSFFFFSFFFLFSFTFS